MIIITITVIIVIIIIIIILGERVLLSCWAVQCSCSSRS